MLRFSLALLLICASAGFAQEDGAFVANDLIGIWQTADTENGCSHIEITRVGDEYEGRIVWLSKPRYDEDDERGMGGLEVIDRENPDPQLREQPILGLRLMHSFIFDGKRKWKDGRIYDPENGKEYRCKLTLQDPDTLEVFGYIKVALVKLGRNTTWTRVTETTE